MPDEKPRAKRKTKTEKRYKIRIGRTGENELECPSCEQYVPLKLWFCHNCPNPIVKRNE
jgi:hypothetical protein